MITIHRLRIPLALAVWLQAAGSAPAEQEPERYELRGKVLQSDGKPFRQVVPHVFLQGSVTPFTAQTVADRVGDFRFKNLLAGMYTLVIAVPRAGEHKETIEVGASFADSRGRIEKTVHFERRAGLESAQAVAASQLAIPAKAQREYEKALEALGERDTERAISYLTKAVEIAPRFSAAWNHLGTIAYQTRNYVKAEEYFREALAQDPRSYPPLVNLGGALLSQGRSAESLEINLRAVDARPDDALAHSQLGQSYFHLGRLDDAVRHLKQAKALDPGHFSFPQIVLAEIYGRRKDYSALIAELEDFLRLHPDAKMAGDVGRMIEAARERLKATPPSIP